MKKGDRLLFFLTLTLLSGCAGIETNYIPLKEGPFLPARPVKEVLVTTGTIPEPYEEIGIILIRKAPGSLEEEIIDKFREEAMVRGADAVIKLHVEKQPFFSIGPFFFSIPFQKVEARGVAVRLKKNE